jgi:hypothetical protein
MQYAEIAVKGSEALVIGRSERTPTHSIDCIHWNQITELTDRHSEMSSDTCWCCFLLV